MPSRHGTPPSGAPAVASAEVTEDTGYIRFPAITGVAITGAMVVVDSAAPGAATVVTEAIEATEVTEVTEVMEAMGVTKTIVVTDITAVTAATTDITEGSAGTSEIFHAHNLNTAHSNNIHLAVSEAPDEGPTAAASEASEVLVVLEAAGAIATTEDSGANAAADYFFKSAASNLC